MTDRPSKVHEWPGFSLPELQQFQLTQSEAMWRWQLPVDCLADRIDRGMAFGVPGVCAVGMALASLQSMGFVASLVCVGIAALFFWASYIYSMEKVREVCLDRESQEVRIIYSSLRRIWMKRFPADLGAELLWYEDEHRDEDSSTKYGVLALPVVGGYVPVLARRARRGGTDEGHEAQETDKDRKARERIESVWAELPHEAGYVGESTDDSPQLPPSTGASARQAPRLET